MQRLAPAAVALATCLLAAPSAAQTLTVDVKCDGIKIGEFRGVLTNPNPNPVQSGSLGAVFKATFHVTNAEERDRRCWCRDYRWFQTVHLTRALPGNGAPGFGLTDIVDSMPTAPIRWGDGNGGSTTVTSDYYPYYYESEGACGIQHFRNKDGSEIKIEDAPSLPASLADPGPYTVRFVTCVACDTVGSPGTGRKRTGQVRLLACVEWGFTITKNGNDYEATMIAPTEVDTTSPPAKMQRALDNFNARPGVGDDEADSADWSFSSDSQACPGVFPPDAPFGPSPVWPGLCAAPVPLQYDAASETLTLGASDGLVLDDQGIDATSTVPAYAGDPVEGGRIGGGTYRYVGSQSGRHYFASDPAGANLYFDDPDDHPNTRFEVGGAPPGNPNGWDGWVVGDMPILVYDSSAVPQLRGLVRDPRFFPGSSTFVSDLWLAMLSSRSSLVWGYEVQSDLAAATNGFTSSGGTTGRVSLAVSDAGSCAGRGDDYLEENDTCATAPSLAPGVYSDLQLADYDEDHYVVTVPAGEQISVDLYFEDDFGDVDVYLFEASDPNCGSTSAGTWLTRGFSATDDESISWLNASAAPVDYVVFVDWWSVSHLGCTQYEMVIDTARPPLGANYCSTNPNSSGGPATISGSGSPVVADNDVRLTAAGLPYHSFGFFIASQSSAFVANPGGSQGNLCVGQPTGRGVGGVIYNSGSLGRATVTADLTAMPQPTGPVAVLPGDTWYLQSWFRDANPTVTSNFTDGLQITFL